MYPAIYPIPPGYNTMSAHLRVRGGDAAIEFYSRAFGAELLHRRPSPDGECVMHAVLQIGDSIFTLSDECPQHGAPSPLSVGGTGSCLHLYVTDTDTAVNRALAAGAKVKMPPADMFWGDRYAKLVDPFGHEWSIATHVRDVTPEEIREASRAAMSTSDC